MTAFNVTNITPDSITGFNAKSGVRSISLNWDASGTLTDKYEVWRHTSDVVGSSTKIATTESNHFSDTNLTSGTTYYYWARIINDVGTTGPFTNNNNALLGSNFANTKIRIWDDAANTVTTSVQNLKGRAYWLTDLGVAADSGLIDFTTTVISSTPGTQSWVNPDNARVDDSSYAVATASGTSQSQDLVFDLGDLGVPSTATLTGLTIQVKGKSTDVTRTNLHAYITDNTNTYTYDSLTFADFTTNDVDDTETLGSSTTLWGLDVIRGATASLLQIISTDTLPPSAVSAGSTTVSIAGGTTSVSSYGTWYSQGYGSFTAAANEVVSISEYVISTVSSITCTGFDQLRVSVRTRLYNVTTSTDVPGGIEQHVIFATIGATNFGNLVNITNMPKTFVVGFRGLLIPTNEYRLYIEIMKEQVSGTPTCSVSVNGSSIAVSGSASLS
jgi:hypothetical protein